MLCFRGEAKEFQRCGVLLLKETQIGGRGDVVEFIKQGAGCCEALAGGTDAGGLFCGGCTGAFGFLEEPLSIAGGSQGAIQGDAGAVQQGNSIALLECVEVGKKYVAQVLVLVGTFAFSGFLFHRVQRALKAVTLLPERGSERCKLFADVGGGAASGDEETYGCMEVSEFPYSVTCAVRERNEREDRRGPTRVRVDAAPGSGEFSKQSLKFSREVSNLTVIKIAGASVGRQ